MNKCPKCGTEFEGKFCPNCGEKFEEKKTCPKCGAECAGGVKFCPACGYSFYAEPSKSAPKAEKQPKEYDEKTVKAFEKIHGFIEPVVLFLIFSVLVFCFYFAPVAVMPALFGEGTGESFGDLYAAFMGEYEEAGLSGCAAALIFFSLLNIPILYLYFLFNSSSTFKNRTVTVLKIYKIRPESITEYAVWVVYLVFMIISAVMLGKISAFDGGLGLFVAGACPILILVFSVVSLVVAVGARLFDNFVILKNFPQFKESAKERLPIEYTADVPQLPQEVQKPLKKDSPLLGEKKLFNYARLKLFVKWYTATFYILLFASSFFIIIPLINGDGYEVEETVLTVCKILSYCLPTASAAIAAIRAFYFYPTSIDTKIGGISGIVTLDIILIIISLLFLNIISAVFIIVLAMYCSSVKEVRKLLYGTNNLKEAKELNEFGKAFSEKQEAYLKSISQAMSAAGYDYKEKWDRRIFWGKQYKIGTILVICVIVAAVLAVISVITAIPAIKNADFSSFGGSLNGTYYAYEKGDYNEDNYIKISGKKWEDDDGETGTIVRNGDAISFMYDFGGEEVELYDGEYISDGVITVNYPGRTTYYCEKGKTPPQGADIDIHKKLVRPAHCAFS